MSKGDLDALRARIDEDRELALRLRRTLPDRFVAEVLRVASERGFDISETEIAAAMVSAQRAWMMRWVR